MKDKRYLTQPGQFAEVYSHGASWVSNLLVLRANPNRLGFPRYGFAISKKTGGAVTRNKLKRRLREIMKGEQLTPGWDMIIIARSAAAGASFTELKSALVSLLCRADLIVRDEELCLKAD